jgi:anthranilate phosphoribosyltransferase
MNLQDAVLHIVSRRDLSRGEAADVMRALMGGEATPVQISALLVALHMKGETVAELTGFAETMRAMATPVVVSRRPLVDTCGTGGDHSCTFNISTTAAFVAAGAGVAVAKHGNRSASSQCGSADVLEALGVNISASAAQAARCIEEIGIGFLFARTLHGAMKHVAPVRTELKLRTVFNLLGPLSNPAGADGQVVGVFSAGLVQPVAEVLAELGIVRAFVVRGTDGLDEMTLGGPTDVAEVADGRVRTYQITPEQFGLAGAPKEALRGDDVETNAALLRAVLAGKPGPHRDVVLLNAAAALVAGRAAADLLEGLELARASIDSGAANGKLEQLVALSHAA